MSGGMQRVCPGRRPATPTPVRRTIGLGHLAAVRTLTCPLNGEIDQRLAAEEPFPKVVSLPRCNDQLDAIVGTLGSIRADELG